jgi:hypothetical protein
MDVRKSRVVGGRAPCRGEGNRVLLRAVAVGRAVHAGRVVNFEEICQHALLSSSTVAKWFSKASFTTPYFGGIRHTPLSLWRALCWAKSS